MGQVPGKNFYVGPFETTLSEKSPYAAKSREPSQFPTNYGFEEQGKKRKERVMIATQEEMIAAKVPYNYRDFCAHKYIQFKACSKSVYPFVIKCEHEKHEWEHCLVDDYNISRKEYEREARLLERKYRKDRLAQLKEERRQMVEAAEGGHEH